MSELRISRKKFAAWLAARTRKRFSAVCTTCPIAAFLNDTQPTAAGEWNVGCWTAYKISKHGQWGPDKDLPTWAQRFVSAYDGQNGRTGAAALRVLRSIDT